MVQVFWPRANLLARGGLALLVLLLGLGGLTVYSVTRSDYVTGVGIEVTQPVPFSHAHHVTGLGIDCRYCHTSVETSAFAGMPSTDTCMNCHSQIWTEAELLEPVRESWAADKAIAWQRVYDLPDFVYFDHSAHVNAGVGCVTCHGQLHEMPVVFKQQPLFMKWCLDCHRAPEQYLRPRDEVFNHDWPHPPDQLAQGRRLIEEHNINLQSLTNCSTCHR